MYIVLAGTHLKWRGEVPSVPVTIKIAARRTSMERSRRQNCCPHNMGIWNEYVMEIQPPPWISTDCWGVTLEDIWGPGKTYSKQWTTSQTFSSSCANVVACRILDLRDFDIIENKWFSYYFDIIIVIENTLLILILFWLFLHFQAFARFCRPTAGGMTCHDVPWRAMACHGVPWRVLRGPLSDSWTSHPPQEPV